MTRHTAARLRLTTLEDRLTPAGWLDPTFGSGGVAPAGLPPTQEHSSGRMATMPDGHIVVVSNNQVTRLNADGSPDLTFGTRGSVTLASPSLAVAAGPGGTTYVLTVRANPRGEGPQTADVQQLAELIRLTPSGALDTTFDDDGLAFVTKGQVYGSYSSGLAVNSGEAVVATSQENLRRRRGPGRIAEDYPGQWQLDE